MNLYFYKQLYYVINIDFNNKNINTYEKTKGFIKF